MAALSTPRALALFLLASAAACQVGRASLGARAPPWVRFAAWRGEARRHPQRSHRRHCRCCCQGTFSFTPSGTGLMSTASAASTTAGGLQRGRCKCWRAQAAAKPGPKPPLLPGQPSQRAQPLAQPLAQPQPQPLTAGRHFRRLTPSYSTDFAGSASHHTKQVTRGLERWQELQAGAAASSGHSPLWHALLCAQVAECPTTALSQRMLPGALQSPSPPAPSSSTTLGDALAFSAPFLCLLAQCPATALACSTPHWQHHCTGS